MDHYNVLKKLQTRKLRGPACIGRTIPPDIYSRTILYKKIMGHLSSVYCVAFDQSGLYIFTGADDHLIKIWSAKDGRLLKTLRGHDGEITDISVNYENRLLASAGMDKIIRIWDLKTSKLLDCLNAHHAVITSIKFSPYNRHGTNRYMISTSNDGSVIFWTYDVHKLGFRKLRKHQERTRPGGGVVCSSFSTGGSFLACGSSDNIIHIYGFTPYNGPYKIQDVDFHKDKVDSIQFCNQGFRFVTGSQDGSAAIWSFRRGAWRPLKLDMDTQIDQTILRGDNVLAVQIVQWSRDDRYVLTSLIDHTIKVWNSHTGELVYILREHKHDVFLLESHPTDPRIFISASHDGTLIIWDLDTSRVLRKFHNRIENPGGPNVPDLASIYDIKFSPDGSMIAATDSYGYLSLYGIGGPQAYDHIPEQMFFHTDYRALIRDMRHFVLDDQTHMAPHLLPKPTLVDMNGDPYPSSLQRLVPDYKSGDKYVIPPLSEIQSRAISEGISNHSMLEDDEFVDSDATELASDEATIVDSEATEIDETNYEDYFRPRILRLTRRTSNRANYQMARDIQGGVARRSSARLRDRKRFRRA